MRASAASMKGWWKNGSPMHDVPAEGSQVRELYDILTNNPGAVFTYLPSGKGSPKTRGTLVPTLQITYELDIRVFHLNGPRPGVKKTGALASYCLVGDDRGRVYKDLFYLVWGASLKEVLELMKGISK